MMLYCAPEMLTALTLLPNSLPAWSKDTLVRVEFSKNKLCCTNPASGRSNGRGRAVGCLDVAKSASGCPQLPNQCRARSNSDATSCGVKSAQSSKLGRGGIFAGIKNHYYHARRPSARIG